MVGGADNGNLRRKGVVKECPPQNSSVTKQVAISRREEWYDLAPDVRREAHRNAITTLPLYEKGANGPSCPARSSLGFENVLRVLTDPLLLVPTRTKARAVFIQAKESSILNKPPSR